jgi:hypothetical protein
MAYQKAKPSTTTAQRRKSNKTGNIWNDSSTPSMQKHTQLVVFSILLRTLKKKYWFKGRKGKKNRQNSVSCCKIVVTQTNIGATDLEVTASQRFHRKSIDHREPLSSDLGLITIPSLMTMKA